MTNLFNGTLFNNKKKLLIYKMWMNLQIILPSESPIPPTQKKKKTTAFHLYKTLEETNYKYKVDQWLPGIWGAGGTKARITKEHDKI